MRIIAVWSLFARWTLRVTESKGCSPHGLKNTSWPTGSLEIFSAERQRIPHSGTFIAMSEHTLNSAYNQHESRASAAPQGDTEWQTYGNGILTTMWRCNDLWKEPWSGREEHGLPIWVARGTATSPEHPHAALRLPVFSPLSLCRVRSMGVRHSPSPFDGTQPSTAMRCISASFRQWILWGSHKLGNQNLINEEVNYS